MSLNQIEKDFIEFISKKRSVQLKNIEDIFIMTKNRFKFYNREYRNLREKIHNLHKIMYDDEDEKNIIDSYKFHALNNLFRFISYSYPEFYLNPDLKLKTSDYLKKFIEHMWNDFKKLLYHISKKENKKNVWILKKANSIMDYKVNAKFLIENIKKPPIVVDYGCGLGYTSFIIGKLSKSSKIYLVDIDCLTLEFTEFRFKKYGINVETIPINKNNIYPKLPVHNICIATEVFEHLLEPLQAYQNIYESLEPGGILFGNFKDHEKFMFHISPNLGSLREKIDGNFQKIGTNMYKKWEKN